MIELFVYTVAAFGLSWVAADSKISYPLRKRLDRPTDKLGTMGINVLAIFLLLLIECIACFSFHIGWIAVAFGLAPFFSHSVAGAIFCAFYTCGASFMLARIARLD